MSLLSDAPAQFTGTGRYVSELLRALGKRPADVRIDVLVGDGVDERTANLNASNVVVHSARGYRVVNFRVGRAVAMSAAWICPRPLARQFPPDVDVVHYPLALRVPAVRSATVQSLFDVLHHDLPQSFSRVQHVWRRVMYDGAARRATAVVTASEHARTGIIDRVGVDPERIHVIHLGVDHSRFTSGPCSADDEKLLAPLALPTRFLLYPASLWDHKNHARLLAAMAQAADDELALVMTGATFGKLGSLIAEAQRLGLGSRVSHLGRVSEEALPALYRRATALVFPSLYEGFGVPPIEAMACGCPVASSREASLSEVCGDAAAELSPRNVEQMAATIDAVANDVALRSALRKKGFRQAQNFTWERNADAHLAVYREASERRVG